MKRLCCLLVAGVLSGCAAQAARPAKTSAPSAAAPAGPITPAASFYPSTYQPPPSAPTLIRNATLLTGTGTRLEHADVLLVDGKISAVGAAVTAPANATVVDGTGNWVTPGIIDVHSHLGVYPAPAVAGNDDGNEATRPAPPTCGPSTRCGRRIRASAPRSPAASRPCRSCPARPT